MDYNSHYECRGVVSDVCEDWCFTDYSANVITGSAVGLYCCKAHSKINSKMENLTPCKIVTPENFILKLGTRDYVNNIT